MARYERLNTLLELLGERGSLDVDAVATELAVSTATIRRDLDHLAEQQLATRIHGGAVANNVAYDLPLRYKTARHAPEKQRIAKAAAALIAPGAVVGINGGTTTTEAARAVAVHPELSAKGAAPVTIVTNALNIAHELVLRPNLKVVVVGGVARPQSYELIGPLATPMLAVLRVDILLLGVDAFDAEHGAAAHHEDEASINQLMASRAGTVVVLADGSKLGARAFAQICPTERISTLITDTTADMTHVRCLESRGVTVIRA